MAFDGTISGGNTLVFAAGQQVLAASDLATGLKTAHGREVVRFLEYCEQVHLAPTVESPRHYLADGSTGTGREALRWLYRASRLAAGHMEVGKSERQTGNEPGPESPKGHAQPSIARRDLGGPDWERDLIVAIRRRGFLWRTETTYREWAAKFAQAMRAWRPRRSTRT